jgi:hypothetical protein
MFYNNENSEDSAQESWADKTINSNGSNAEGNDSHMNEESLYKI